jgi:hypothetical protein
MLSSGSDWVFTHEVVGNVLDAVDRLKRAEVRETERLRLAPAASRVAAAGASGQWVCQAFWEPHRGPQKCTFPAPMEGLSSSWLEETADVTKKLSSPRRIFLCIGYGLA